MDQSKEFSKVYHTDAGQALHKLKDRIISQWEEAVRNAIPVAQHHDARILQNSLPDFLDILAEILSGNLKQDQLARVSKLHGRERAGLPEYTIGQLLLEYHHLRRTIIDLVPTTEENRERIHDYVDRAIAEAGEEFHTQCMIRQIAEKKATDRANKDLRDEQSVRQRFMLALSHDLRSPLSAARMAAENLIRHPNVSDLEKFGAIIIRNLERANRMIEDLLDTNLIQAGGELTLDISETDLFRIASDVVENLEQINGDRFIVEGGSVQGFWDARYIRRIVENLLSNSLKYGRKDRPVKITLGRERGQAFLCVYNEGDPISKEEQDSIFDQFHRVKPQEGHEIGWGIGLALVRGAVKAHGGSIEIRSPINEGTEFRIFLPLDARKKFVSL